MAMGRKQMEKIYSDMDEDLKLKMVGEFKNNTIRRRLIILSTATLAFLSLLAVTFYFNVFSLKSDIATLEDFYNLFNNVLELRRYEKNFFLGIGSDNYQQIMYYLDNIEENTERLSDSITRTVDKIGFLTFRQNFLNYRTTMKQIRMNDKQDVLKIRELGKQMVEFTQNVLDQKRTQIHGALHRTLVGFMLTTVCAIMFIFLMIHFQVVNVLLRLVSLRKATKKVAHGDFTPIDYDRRKEDEISSLIQDFNKMISEIESRQEQLLRTRRLAAIGTFSSGIAHELNNPLNNISLTADTLYDEYDSLDPAEGKELIVEIIDQTDRASSVVKNLLDFCREAIPEQQNLNIKEVIEGTAKVIRNQFRLASVWLEDYLPDSLPPVRGNKNELQQVFLNLFLNSIHAMPEGGLIHLDGGEEPKGYIRIGVNDTGSGISAEKIEHIFDPFYTTKPVGQGTGLGLSIVYGIVKKHGGYIEVRSKDKQGTTFSIFLPIAAEKDNEKDNGSSSSN